MITYDKINLHSHTVRCGHGEGWVTDYGKEAEKHGMKILGISEHTPFPEKRDVGIRMDYAEFPLYIEEIEQAGEEYPSITFLKGLECDYTPEYLSFYKELKEQYHLDYLIGSLHFFSEQKTMISYFVETMDHAMLKNYTEHMLANMDVDMFDFIAHPDLFCLRLEKWDDYAQDCAREICKMAELKKRPLEININGYHREGSPYPNEKFWRIAADYEIATLINTDAHRVEHLCADKEVGKNIQDKYHLKQWDYAGIF